MNPNSLNIAFDVFDGAVRRAFDEGVAAGVDEGELASLFLQAWEHCWESRLWRKAERMRPDSPPSISTVGDDKAAQEEWIF
jgi:hypothetical protein